jgi:hypothetical protein
MEQDCLFGTSTEGDETVFLAMWEVPTPETWICMVFLLFKYLFLATRMDNQKYAVFEKTLFYKQFISFKVNLDMFINALIKLINYIL